MKKIVKYNLVIALLQFIIFALLLFAVFFFKFRMDEKVKGNSSQSFVIERNEY